MILEFGFKVGFAGFDCGRVGLTVACDEDDVDEEVRSTRGD